MAAQLVYLQECPHVPKNFELNPKRVVTVGRSSLNDLVLDDKKKEHNNMSSRTHAKLKYLANSGWELTDLNSTNGVFHERSGDQEKRVSHVTLKHGDVITFGGAIYRFRFEVKNAQGSRDTTDTSEQLASLREDLEVAHFEISELKRDVHQRTLQYQDLHEAQSKADQARAQRYRDQMKARTTTHADAVLLHQEKAKQDEATILQQQREISALKSTINDLQRRSKEELDEERVSKKQKLQELKADNERLTLEVTALKEAAAQRASYEAMCATGAAADW
jgi:pSer/pThr/pTyr-binding forkhead associated (FHA) protein